MLMKKEILYMECIEATDNTAHFVQEADPDEITERAEVDFTGSDASEFLVGRVYAIEFEYVRRAAIGTEADSEVGE